MVGEIFFWLGLLGLISGLGVGISLLEDESSFIRNVMFAVGIAVVMFIFILELGGTAPFQIGNTTVGEEVFLVVSFLIGAAAVMLVTFVAKGNERAAFIAGGLAGMTMYLMSRYLPSGSFGYTGLDDIPTLISIAVTMLVGGLTYYLLRNLGKRGDQWD
jgi:hypothetical protein